VNHHRTPSRRCSNPIAPVTKSDENEAWSDLPYLK
jgi:hypothetical protein